MAMCSSCEGKNRKGWGRVLVAVKDGLGGLRFDYGSGMGLNNY